VKVVRNHKDTFTAWVEQRKMVRDTKNGAPERVSGWSGCCGQRKLRSRPKKLIFQGLHTKVLPAMFNLFTTILRVSFSGFQSRRQLTLENLALRHQLVVLQRSVQAGLEVGNGRLVLLKPGLGSRSGFALGACGRLQAGLQSPTTCMTSEGLCPAYPRSSSVQT
jgi:hypothetical protein